MGEQILEAGDLGRLLFADHDGLVAPAPDLVLPTGAACNLASEIGVEVTHEESELLSVVDVQEKVKVVRQEDIAAEPNGEETLRAPKDAQKDVVELDARQEEKSGLLSAAGNLDESAPFGDETQFPGHGENLLGTIDANRVPFCK